LRFKEALFGAKCSCNRSFALPAGVYNSGIWG
jgi:hypothetical protein